MFISFYYRIDGSDCALTHQKPLWNPQPVPNKGIHSKPQTKTKPAPLAKKAAVSRSQVNNDDDDNDDANDDNDNDANDDASASKTINESYGKTARIVYPSYGGLKLMAQHPVLQDVIRGAHFKIAVDSMFENAYPTITSRPAFTRPILIAVAREKKATEIKERAKQDPSFAKTFAPMVCHFYHVRHIYTNGYH